MVAPPGGGERLERATTVGRRAYRVLSLTLTLTLTEGLQSVESNPNPNGGLTEC